MGSLHEPVLLNEVLEGLEADKGGTFVDCTLGLGGHAEAILKASPESKIIGFDRDSQAIAKASERLSIFEGRFRIFHDDYRNIKTVLTGANINSVNGILADLGVSSWQLDDAERGFSFRYDAKLDMRMNQDSDEPNAADLLRELSEEDLANVIYEFGEERHSRKIARRIVQKRENGESIETTKQLADLVAGVVRNGKFERIHPATKTFQGLRIAVNRELDDLDEFLRDAVDILQPDGRLAVISFHSLEDRIAKQTLRQLAGYCVCPPRLPVCNCGATEKIEIMTRRPIVANETELARNPRARSAKLRVCKKLNVESFESQR
ncbi:MAG: 16S rRNA (cytosine(1402)-N(4))-methyltransferase RsmH [Pyrinomonadaceae bacterium]|nr:16S rRNA (cytosine(1402)-N(4))-methyltransferase RsmH [Pyrinomonadaceae bacterium]